MEDRHNLSEARPVPGLELPTWDVDILREGVDTPIMTLRIDERALPPRRGGGGRKKNSKVVWKLPDTLEQIPKFGREDKARILEIFKQQKKTLKREKKNKSSSSSSSSPQEEGEAPNDDTGETSPLPSPSPTKGGKYPPPPPPDDDDEDEDSNEKFFTADISKKESSFSGPPGFQSLSVEEKKQSEIMEGKNPRPPPPPGLSTPAGGPLIPSASASASSFSATEASSLSSIPFSPPSQPPPGILHPMPPGLPQTAVSSSLKNAPLPPPPPGMQPTIRAASTSTSPTKQTPLVSQETTIPRQPQPQTPPLRYFQLPPGSTPISSSTSSSSSSSSTTTNHNHLAQVVTQSYYYMLTHGHVQELKAHYAPVGAAKSLTVGGAHAICHSLSDMELQLQSLVGMVVAIRGVLQQSIPITAALACPSSSSDGNVHNNNKNNSSNHASMILLVITGMCVRPHALPFCHSLVLTPVVVDAARQHGGGEGEGGGGGGGGATTTTTTTTNPTTIIGYQIQNDALCFLTTEAVVTAAAASPSP